MDDIILNLAKKYFDVETLETRNRDSLDFYSVSVGSIKAALEAAFKAGKESVSVKEEEAPKVAALLKDNSARRMRELAGIPHKDNFV